MKQHVAAGLLASLCGTAHADLLVNLQSEKGDYIGQGESRTLSYAPSDFSVTTNASGDIHIYASGSRIFQISLSPLRGVTTTLAAGMCYDRAGMSSAAGRPGLDISMDGRGCSSNMARFRIRELNISGTQVQSLAVDFAQSCHRDGGPALFGNLRLNSPIPTTTPFIDAPYDATGSLQFSAIGFGVGSNAPGGAATIAFTRLQLIAYHAYPSGIDWSYLGPLPGLAGDSFWQLDFAAPDNGLIVSGDYLDAERFPFQSAGKPGLSFGYDGAGAGALTGSFHVGTATYEPYDGLPQDFVASFVQNAGGQTADQTIGELTYHATYRNGGRADEIFPNGFESGQIAPLSQTSLAYPCAMP